MAVKEKTVKEKAVKEKTVKEKTVKAEAKIERVYARKDKVEAMKKQGWGVVKDNKFTDMSLSTANRKRAAEDGDIVLLERTV